MFEQEYTNNEHNIENDNSLESKLHSEKLFFDETNCESKTNIKIQESNIFEQELNCLFDTEPDEAINQIKRRINDFDSSLILENATKTVNNKSLKIELKIASTEKELDKVQEQINLLELLNLDYDKERLAELHRTKEIIEGQIEQLKEEYKSMGLIYYISDFTSSLFTKFKKFFSKKTCSKIAKKINKIIPFFKKNIELNNEIKKLKLIEQKLTEKSQVKTPYGENESEMNNFIQFLGVAKTVDAKINRIVNQE